MNELLDKTIEITRSAGDLVMTFFKKADLSITEKSPDNPLSEADLASDQFLKEKLLELLPEAGWLSEETADTKERLGHEYVWIVDPIDGTKEFVTGVPEFTISVGLVKNGKTILGVVYNPVTKEMIYAGENTGTYLNDEKIVVTNTQNLSDVIVDASNSEMRRDEFAPFESQVSRITSVGSIAYKLARIAAGKTDASWSRGPKNEWDICAGVHVIKEAGGKVTNLDKKDFVFNQERTLVNGIIASNGQVFEDIYLMLLPHRDSART